MVVMVMIVVVMAGNDGSDDHGLVGSKHNGGGDDNDNDCGDDRIVLRQLTVSEHSWPVLSCVFAHWLLHQCCMAWRFYTTCQGPCEPDVSSGRLLDQQSLQPWLLASCNTATSSVSSDPFLASCDQHGGKCLSPTCPSRVCAGLSSA